MPVYRNLYVMHPLMRKGGAHMSSKSGQRSRDRFALRDEVAEYLDEVDQSPVDDPDIDDLTGNSRGEHDAPLSFFAVYLHSLFTLNAVQKIRVVGITAASESRRQSRVV